MTTRLPIRWRLTIWYAAFLVGSMILLGAGFYLGTRTLLFGFFELRLRLFEGVLLFGGIEFRDHVTRLDRLASFRQAQDPERSAFWARITAKQAALTVTRPGSTIRPFAATASRIKSSYLARTKDPAPSSRGVFLAARPHRQPASSVDGAADPPSKTPDDVDDCGNEQPGANHDCRGSDASAKPGSTFCHRNTIAGAG